MTDTPHYALLTEDYLRQSILTSYPLSALELFRELRPDEWKRHFGDFMPSQKLKNIEPKLTLLSTQIETSNHYPC